MASRAWLMLCLYFFINGVGVFSFIISVFDCLPHFKGGACSDTL